MKYRALIAGLMAVMLGLLTACNSGPDMASGDSKELLTYEDIRGTGLANKCPLLSETSRGSIPIDSNQSYEIKELCMQPTNYYVKEEPLNKRQEAEFVGAKILTRKTSSLDQIQGDLNVNSDGSLTFEEKDGFDFQAISVQLPGGEQVPFLFTVKNLVAKTQPNLTSINTSTDFEGDFKVPSYRGATFLDPKGRGVASGYDNAVALPSQADSEELRRANVKRVETGNGHISLNVAKVDNISGEIAGTFVSEQPSDTDLGAGEPLDVKVRGVFYARVEPVS
ncbi:photosystem II manganese-stabilizing protein PsbO [Calothrix parasitica NIES-267]|uniref:Photosystem II extrinsic protein O n=1 Tax=Calothrix parasitica NIES-267 TaxID=1973488 RepID=A0A1Z4LWW6_9CYAN|nr:photosystem II manganese-stabilizing protein PsbO [Calothrix parasitica NIES-267]